MMPRSTTSAATPSRRLARARAGARRRSGERGLTLLEVLVSIAIIALVGMLIYGAFQGMTRSRDSMAQVNDRHHQGRTALARMARELGSAFLGQQLSLVNPLTPAHQTAFIGSDSRPTDRIDFDSFSHLRLRANAHESDQNEVSYFGSNDPDTGKLDLVRRESKYIDADSTRGGIVQVVAQDIDSFDVRYLDPLTGEWLESWDSTQPAAQIGRLPSQVWITLVLRDSAGGGNAKFETKIPLAMQLPLDFATKP
jgi:general secretion pathway protein J